MKNKFKYFSSWADSIRVALWNPWVSGGSGGIQPDSRELISGLDREGEEGGALAIPAGAGGVIYKQVDVYGSFASELCLPWSDIDIVIQVDRYTQIEILSKIEAAIKVLFLNQGLGLGHRD